MKNKQAKGEVALYSILGILVVGLLIVGFTAFGGTSQTAIGGTETQTGEVVSTGCNVNPTLSNIGINALSKGTSVTLTPQYFVNGILGGSNPTFGAGDKVTGIIGATGYINKTLNPVTIICGANTLQSELYQYGNATITIKDNAGTGILVDHDYVGSSLPVATGNIGTTNESSSTSSLTWQIKLVGSDKKSTGKQLFIAEIGTPTTVSDITLSGPGATEVAVPSGYTRQGTNQYAAAFEIPEINGANVVYYDLTITSNNGNAINNTAYTSFFAERAFINTDGSIVENGAWDQINGAQWMDRQNYNIIIK